MALFISMFFLCGIRMFFRNSFPYREQDDRNLTCIRRFCILFDIPLPDRKRSSAIIGNHEIFQSEQPGTFAFCRARLEPMSCGSVSRHGEVAGRRGLSVRLLRLPSFCYSTCLFLKGFISDTRTGSRARKDGVVRSPFSISKDGS